MDWTNKHDKTELLTISLLKAYLADGGNIANAERLSTIAKEFEEGFEFLDRKKPSVTFFGSARTPEDGKYYQIARDLAKRFSQELDYSMITGGGPGIMEAGNRGAKEAGHNSYGLTIKLPHEQVTNPYLTQELPFYYFFSRKVMMSFAASAYIYFPGGFGTLDELFEILTLVQTRKIEPVPVILFGSEFWNGLDAFIKKTLRDEFKTIDFNDTDLYTITDDADEVLRTVAESAKPRD